MAAAGLACALLALLLLRGGEPAAAQGGEPSLTLSAAPDEVLLGESARLRGRLTNPGLGGPDGREVSLLASSYPYTSESRVATTTTDADGDFSFPVTPELNTRYRVRFEGAALEGSATSHAVKVFVFPRSGFRSRVLQRRGIIRAALWFRYSPQVEPEYYAGKPVFWYFRRLPSRRVYRVKMSRFADTAAGVATSVAHRLPRSRRGYRFEFFPCVPAPARDVGVGNDLPASCPKRFTIRRG